MLARQTSPASWTEPRALYGVVLLFWVALLAMTTSCSSVEDKVELAIAEGDHDRAIQLLWAAAVDSQCPERGLHLIRRAEVQQVVARDDEAVESVTKAVTACPNLIQAYWTRAQLHAKAGRRQDAINDAREAAPAVPQATLLQHQLEDELAAEAAAQKKAQDLVESLGGQLDLDAEPMALEDSSPAQLARQVPLPMHLDYGVTQSVKSPISFEMSWVELLSFRGHATSESYSLVRKLEVPKMDRALPLYYRLLMSNQRLPMRFLVNRRGDVLTAEWHRDGPDRGMRPQMLGPEIQGMLKRKRVYDPGSQGVRSPGESWNGEDVRIVDGRPIAIQYSSTAQGWELLHGIRVLRVKSRLTGNGYTGTEEAWMHPTTSVAVRWSRRVAYEVTRARVTEAWQEETVGTLLSVHGLQ